MTREIIIEELIKRGYRAEPTTVSKNNVELAGICIRMETAGSEESEVSPVIYMDQICSIAKEYNFTPSETVDRLIQMLNDSQPYPDFLSRLKNRNFILQNIKVALQKNTRENIVKKDSIFPGIESYLFIAWDNYSVKVKKELLDLAKVSEQEAWEAATENTLKSSVIMNIEDFTLIPSKKSAYIVSDKQIYRGASAILNTEKLQELAENHNTDVLILLPSSVNEFIVIPYMSGMDDKGLAEMVRQVNTSMVRPEERLADNAYKWNVKTGLVEVLLN